MAMVAYLNPNFPKTGEQPNAMAPKPSTSLTMYMIYTSNFAKKTMKLYAICPEKDLDLMLGALEEGYPRIDFEIDTVADMEKKYGTKVQGAIA